MSNHNGKRAVVIGSGFGGLSVAAFLARDGWNVTVLEKNDLPGGRAQSWEQEGFRFDMGPSWYLMPDVFERFFAQFGRASSDYYSLKRLDPSYRIFFAPDDYIDISSDLSENLRQFEAMEAGAGDAMRRYLEVAKHEYEVSLNEFVYRDFSRISDFLNRRTLLEGRKLHVFENLEKYTARYFSSQRLRKILEYSMVFLGGSPQNTPALYSMLAHVDFNLGVWYPSGGIAAVVHGLRALAAEHGAAFQFGRAATSIGVRGNRAVSVAAGADEVPADLVVVNADYAYAETSLLERRYRTYPERYWQRRTFAPSAFMMYLGIRKRLPRLQHHTLLFEHDWVEHFNSIFQAPGWPERPSYYFCCPSRTDDAVAPPGCENVVALIPVATGLDDPDDVRDAYATRVLEQIERLTGESLRQNVAVCRVFSQRDFVAEFNAYQGTALGLSHTLMQTALFRPAHRSKRIANLYYTGQYTHPGIGLAMALVSSEIVAKRVGGASR
ncbi:MAG: phytoene desaturase [Armatimonadota bacterium]|nr:MAG: phytoene desaturase [Armatimonadota bacterium]